MENVVSLRGGAVEVPEKEPPNENLLFALAELTRAAEAGEFHGMVAVLVSRDGGVGHCMAGNIPFYAALGGIEMAKMNLVVEAEGD